MRNLHPMASTGALFHHPSDRFLGSCFVFRDVNTLLTAAHCVADLEPDEVVLEILVPGDHVYEVETIERHPTADLAVLKVNGVDERQIRMPNYSIVDDRSYGVEVISCGFPEDSSIVKMIPTPRFFRGYVQRFVEWPSHLGYRYLAAELSFRCPAGLSGGPLLNAEFVGRTYGVITENIRTSNVEDSIEEIDKDGKIYREHFQNIIYYGIALWLPAVEDWINSVLPPLSMEEQVRRGELQHQLDAEDRLRKGESTEGQTSHQ